jgi:hypothetical protein
VSISAMKQALDAMESFSTGIFKGEFTSEIAALRQAIAEAESVKCIVEDCENHRHEGGFVGNLCIPCHEFITTGEGVYSQAYRNTKREWVGLTNEEIVGFIAFDGASLADFIRHIEAKLKEKNT